MLCGRSIADMRIPWATRGPSSRVMRLPCLTPCGLLDAGWRAGRRSCLHRIGRLMPDHLISQLMYIRLQTQEFARVSRLRLPGWRRRQRPLPSTSHWLAFHTPYILDAPIPVQYRSLVNRIQGAGRLPRPFLRLHLHAERAGDILMDSWIPSCAFYVRLTFSFGIWCVLGSSAVK